MYDMLTAKDQVSIAAIAREINVQCGSTEIAVIAKMLGVSLMSEWRNRQTIPERLAPAPIPVEVDIERDRQLTLARGIIALLMEKSSAVQSNDERNTYALWFKQYITKLLDEGASYKRISLLTGISEDNLPRFRRDASLLLTKEPCSEDHEFIQKAWDEARWAQAEKDAR